LSRLQRLAEGGLTAIPDNELSDTVEWCWDWGVATGDARFCVLWRVLGCVDEWWGEQGVPSKLLGLVDARLQRGLTDTLEAPNAASGAQFAHQMGQELPLVGPNGWEAGGWLDEAG
jgi:hypothetical protein